VPKRDPWRSSKATRAAKGRDRVAGGHGAARSGRVAGDEAAGRRDHQDGLAPKSVNTPDKGLVVAMKGREPRVGAARRATLPP
jgi:hypothetical protein